jgi:hypothetical protein
MSFNSKRGASVSRPPSIDSNEDCEIDFNNHRDNMDQDIPARQFPTAQSEPIEQFLNGMPESAARLDEHDSRRHQPGSVEPPQYFRRTYST